VKGQASAICVRIAHAPETEQRGFAGREGEVHGESVPSVSGVAAIGDRGEDHAFAVYFHETGERNGSHRTSLSSSATGNRE
jgi:hypothetical protein